MSLATQSSWPPIEYTLLNTFAWDAEFRARVPFAYGDDWYVGGQNTCVGDDLRAWDFWRFGRWRGPAPLRAVPSNLRVGGDVTWDDSNEAAPIARVASGGNLTAAFEILYGSNLSGFSLERRLFAPDGAGAPVFFPSTSNATQTIPLGTLTPGSWTLWVRLAQVATQNLSAEEYQALTENTLSPQYKYSEDTGDYFWDWRRNLGRLPADPDNLFYENRAALELAGATQDRPEWAAYVSGPNTQEGEWSLLRIQVGDGDWAPASNEISPGPALYRKAQGASLETAMEPVYFDVAARSVSAAIIARDGKLLVAGNRASNSGPQLALWRYDGNTTEWALLGLNPNLSNGLCECALSSHDCGSILQDDHGTYVLTKCSLHRYDFNGATLLDRLPDYPASTGGHPGGQCLQSNDGALAWLTEYFGGTLTQNGTAQFYNTFESLSGAGQRRSGIGTAYHGPNAMTQYRGGLWGVVQDKPFSDPDARQRLAALSGQSWTQNPPDWPAEAYQMQHLESARAMLLVCGVERGSELPIAAVLDPGGADGDGALQFSRFPFRVERLQRIIRNGAEEILILGKHVTTETATLDNLPYSLVHLPFRMGKPYPHFCLQWDEVDSSFAIEKGNLPEGMDPAKAPTYLRYRSEPAGIGAWIKSAEVPAPPYLEKIVTSTHLRYHLHGELPYSIELFDKICYTVTGDPNRWPDPWPPEPKCDTAACVEPKLPPGTKYMILNVPLTREWWSLQIDDAQADQPLAKNLRNYPAVWLCLDPAADIDDHTNFNVPVPRVNDNGRVNLPRTLTPEDGPIRAIFLWPPEINGEEYEVRTYAISPVE